MILSERLRARALAAYLPALCAGIGTMDFPILSTSSGGMCGYVISDSYTPGATALTRMGIFLSANSVANILVRCVAAAFVVLYANYVRQRKGPEPQMRSPYLVLCQLVVPAEASDIDDRGRIESLVFAALGEKTEESGRHEVQRRCVDAEEATPVVIRRTVEQCTTQCLGVLVLWCRRIVEPRGERPTNPCT